ncbi:MAG: energy transducer TonB [Mucilaginibacter sp.]
MKRFLLLFISVIFSTTLYAQQTGVANADDNGDKIYTSPVEVMPEYKGGMERLYNRLQHIRYLFLDRMKNIEGKVWVSLVIEKDGSVNDVKMLRGLTEEQDKEVIRVVKNLRRWNPGMQDGKPVRVQYTLPIDFKMIKS